MTKTKIDTSGSIDLSQNTSALLGALQQIKQRPVDDFSKITVSQVVSFLAIVYEKVRNALEYQEDNLIQRSAIERILRRRLSINPSGKNEGENVVRELMWARYIEKNSIDSHQIEVVQRFVNKYLWLTAYYTRNKTTSLSREYISNFLLEMLSVEIEEYVNYEKAEREKLYTYYIFQTLHEKVSIENVDSDTKDLLFFTAVEISYSKNDIAFIRHHLFHLLHKPIMDLTKEEIEAENTSLLDYFKRIDSIVKDKRIEKLKLFTRKKLPPFRILFNILNELKSTERSKLLQSKEELWHKVKDTCQEKYKQSKVKLNRLAIRSFIYIFVTKMVLALILEIPVSYFIYEEIEYVGIAVNTLFHPLLMALIVLWFRLPGEENTIRIFNRVVNIIDADQSFETSTVVFPAQEQAKNPLLASIFFIIYVLAFGVTLMIIHFALQALHFSLISELLFIFFISVVSFFAYRIKQVINEYKLIENETIIAPIKDFFFIPILALGKIFSDGLSKVNIFTVIFDVIIEAPFKMIIEIFEEWTRFMRARKDEIA